MRYFTNISFRTYIGIAALTVILIYLLTRFERQNEASNSEYFASMKQVIINGILGKTSGYAYKSSKPLAPQTRILKWKGNHWEQQNDFCLGKYHYDKIQLKTPGGTTPMYIHPVKKDKYISGDLKTKGIWEAPHIKLFKSLLDKEPDAGVFDIGSELGLYSLYAAKMGRKAVAVDPLDQNVLRFCRSVQEGNLTELITIFFAAVSSSHKKVSFRGEPDHIAGTRIQEVPSDATTSGNYTNFISDTSLLNDMLEELHFKKAIMKIDVESHEYQALKAADNIFKNVDIRGIIMEWGNVNTIPEDAKKLVDLLTGYGFKPMGIGGNLLNPKTFKSWPFDIQWQKM